MSPTVFRERGFRLFFFSREESRMHVHVQTNRGEAKVWLEPNTELAQAVGLSEHEVNDALHLVRNKAHELRHAWQQHFG